MYNYSVSGKLNNLESRNKLYKFNFALFARMIGTELQKSPHHLRFINTSVNEFYKCSTIDTNSLKTQ